MNGPLFARAALVVLLAAPASIAEIRLVTTRPDAPFVAQLVRELKHLGFRVTVASPQAAAPALPQLVLGPELTLALPSPDGTATRRVLRATNDPVEAAEEVHALLLPPVPSQPSAPLPPPIPSQPSPPPPIPSVAPPPPLAAPVPALAPHLEVPRGDSARRLSVDLYGGAGVTFGMPVPGAAALFGATYFPRSLSGPRWSLGFGAGATVPIVAERVRRSGVSPAGDNSAAASAGSADVRAYSASLEVVLRSSARHWAADFGLFAGAARVGFVGSAAAPFVTSSPRADTAIAGLRLRATYRFGRLGVFAEGRALAALPRLRVDFVGTEVSSWGAPHAIVAAGVSVAF